MSRFPPAGVFLNRTAVFPAHVQQLLLTKVDVVSVWSPGLEQNRDLESILIKPEQEKLWTSQDGEKLNELEETDIAKFPFTMKMIERNLSPYNFIKVTLKTTER
ncbi:hypothetical protein Q8A73_020894 [Channa argus]|nr:hypothetical protein Q8A73_020894 [Channa argus]